MDQAPQAASADPESLTPGIPLTDDVVSAAIKGELDAAITFVDSDLGLARAVATKYYFGDKFGDEEPGRSKIVMPVVRDTVRATLPSLMRIFFGSTNVVEFSPGSSRSPQAAIMATDATATVNNVVMNQNAGWMVFWGAFKDALVRKTGWVTWWWDDSIRVTAKDYTGVTEQQLQEADAALEREFETLDILGKHQVGLDTVPGQPQPELVPHPTNPGAQIQVMMPGPPQQVPRYEYAIRITRKAPRNKVCVESVPPEEVIFSAEGASVDGERPPALIGRRQMKKRGDLLAMGVPVELLNSAGGGDLNLTGNAEVLARNPNVNIALGTARSGATKDQEMVPYYDLFYRIDADQDGYTELMRYQVVGTDLKIFKRSYANDVNLALFCPDPEPHLMVGLSQADSLMDLQVIGSHIWRDVLDSLKASIFPRTAYVEGQVNVDDVLNTEIGASIRMRAPGMVQEMSHEFTGQRALPLFDLLDSVREQRTGIGKAAMGMDAGALQSTTADAAMQSVTASQAQVELIARIFAETGMKRVFRGVLQLLVEYQDHGMQFRLHGHDYAVNPTTWDADMDVSIDTGLGYGNVGMKLQALTTTAQAQNTMVAQMGPNNPMCSLQEVYNTYVKMLQMAGIHDVQNYWRDPSQAQATGATVQPPKSPEQTLAEAEMAIKKAQESREMLDIILTDDREREAQVADMYLRAADIMGKYGAQVDVAKIQAAMRASAATASAAVASAQPALAAPAPQPAPAAAM